MKSYFAEDNIRKAICDVGQKMYDKDYVAANDGNISVKINERQIIVTPTGISKGGMVPGDLIKMALDENILLGKGAPSSEVKMHLEKYIN